MTRSTLDDVLWFSGTRVVRVTRVSPSATWGIHKWTRARRRRNRTPPKHRHRSIRATRPRATSRASIGMSAFACDGTLGGASTAPSAFARPPGCSTRAGAPGSTFPEVTRIRSRMRSCDVPPAPSSSSGRTRGKPRGRPSRPVWWPCSTARSICAATWKWWTRRDESSVAARAWHCAGAASRRGSLSATTRTAPPVSGPTARVHPAG